MSSARAVVLGLLLFLGSSAVQGNGAACASVVWTPECVSWAKQYDGPGPLGHDASVQVLADADGRRVYSLVGANRNTPLDPDLDIAVVAYEASSGKVAWQRLVDLGATEVPAVMVLTPGDELLLVAGAAERVGSDGGPPARFDGLLLALNPVTGDVLWSLHFDEDASNSFSHLTVSSDGSTAFVAGWADFGLEVGVLVAAVDLKDRALRWVYRTPEVLTVEGLVLVEGGQKLALLASPIFAQIEVHLLSVEDGSVTTQRILQGAIPVALAGAGDAVYVLGTWFDGPSYDLYIARMDLPSLQVRWQRWHGGAGHEDDEAVGLALAPSGDRLFVVGTTHGPVVSPLPVGLGLGTDADWTTLALRTSDGAVQWSANFDGTMPVYSVDKARGIEASPRGVLVWGTVPHEAPVKVEASAQQDPAFVVYTFEGLLVDAVELGLPVTGAHGFSATFAGPGSVAGAATVPQHALGSDVLTFLARVDA